MSRIDESKVGVVPNVTVMSGDIATFHADALITAINSGGMWYGGIDDVIKRAAGQAFHNQARKASPLSDCQTIVARGDGIRSTAKFANVVFVVDDLQSHLADVVYAGLEAAHQAGFSHITLPTIRMGVMLGIKEKSKKQAVFMMVAAVKKFLKRNPNGFQSITFVVYEDPEVERLLRAEL